MINESFDETETPNKKRKRDNLSRFVSSTPIKLANKENFLFSDSLCMEVKSIAELVAERNASKSQPKNEFEVIRKPPKKKKKIVSEESCFINPGLDLKVDEKVINPFEVVRSDNTEAIMLAQGVSNPALDVAISAEPSVSKASTNPFEVVRESMLPGDAKGIENSALELAPSAHTQLVLQLPFTPTVNHRIDFSNMPSNLTPSSLLASKLVIATNDNSIGTPKRNATAKSRKSLSIISEVSEDVEIDIGEELDNFQLQLENSINEAKMRNQKYVFEAPKTIDEESEENDAHEQEEAATKMEQTVNDATYTKETIMIEVSTQEIQIAGPEMLSGLKESDVDDERFNDDNNEDVQFEEVDSFEEDFGKLGQFQRAYRTDAPPTFKRPITKPSEAHPKKSNLGGSIRRSIRKMIGQKSNENPENEKHEGLFQTIRHSLRRKPKPKAAPANLENSIMDRAVFRETSNVDEAKRTLQRPTLKRHVVKTMKTFMESVEEFDHY